MTEIRTLVRVALVIKPPGGAKRHIVAWIDRLSGDLRDDPGRGLETFRLSIEENGKLVREREEVLPALRYLKYELARQLHRILNAVDYPDPEEAKVADVVEIIEDTHGLIELQACHCQHCGSVFLEHFGYLGAVVKKCKCGRYTVCCDALGRRKQF